MKPFVVDVPHQVLDDLQRRLETTRWADERSGSGWTLGTPRPYMLELVEYWRTQFDWRAQERRINTFAHYKASVGDVDLHFIHEPAEASAAIAVLLLHGWPSTFWEFHKIIEPLVSGATSAEPGVTVVVPSLPGYAFSHQPSQRRFDIDDCAEILIELMTTTLGYRRFVVAGGDWGAYIAARMANLRPDAVAALHLNMLPLRRDSGWPPSPSAEEQRYLDALEIWQHEEAGYSHLQGTRPQTPAYALNDSPAGLAAWLIEKFALWSDSGADPDGCFGRDDLLTTVMLYWITESIGSSFWLYYARHHGAWTVNDLIAEGTRLEVPTYYVDFPRENIRPPRSLAEQLFDLRRWVTAEAGGHFPALEQPAVLAEGIASCASAALLRLN